MKRIAQYLIFFVLLTAGAYATSVRATVDIGSGATKLRVAEIDLDNQRIVKILETKTFAVPYQEQLARSKDGNFDEAVMKTGIDALKQSVEIAKKYNVDKIIAVATAAFRKAHNADQFIEDIYRQTGIKVYVIDQNLEGELAFKATAAELGVAPANLIVWDIGGGSLQMTTINRLGQMKIFRGVEASVPFRNYIISDLKKDPSASNTPNPMDFEEFMRAGLHARQLAKKVDTFFKQKIQEPQAKIVGVGNIFGLQIYNMLGKTTITRDELLSATANLVNKTDADVGGGDFANVFVSNAIFVLGYMEELGITEMEVADINPADGAFFYASFWNDRQAQTQMAAPAAIQNQPVAPSDYQVPVVRRPSYDRGMDQSGFNHQGSHYEKQVRRPVSPCGC